MVLPNRVRCTRGGHFVTCIPCGGEETSLVLPMVGGKIAHADHWKALCQSSRQVRYTCHEGTAAPGPRKQVFVCGVAEARKSRLAGHELRE